uniref:Uncharacterized protein n=1 Tax=Anguilla anguilla TaxID=7936 RepID=A0A0E9UCQ0_ANGAN
MDFRSSCAFHTGFSLLSSSSSVCLISQSHRALKSRYS